MAGIAKLSNDMLNPLTLGIQRRISGLPYNSWYNTAVETFTDLLALIKNKRAANTGNEIDMTSLLISAKDEEGNSLSDEEILGEFVGTIAAGHETTATTITHLLFMLATHPDVANKLCSLDQNSKEFDAYFDAVLNETMRLFPVVPFSIPKRVTKNVFVKDGEKEILLPEGATVALSSLLTHRDESVFPESNKFLPDRWLVPGFKPSPYQFFPFGAGARRCLGAMFAVMQMKIVVKNIISRFSMGTESTKTLDPKVISGLVLQMKQPLRMDLKAVGNWSARNEPLKGTMNTLVELPVVGLATQ